MKYRLFIHIEETLFPIHELEYGSIFLNKVQDIS